MHRYLSSFIISTIFYVAILAVILYLYSKNDFTTQKVQHKSPECVHFAIIEPAKVKEIKPVEKPKPKPKPKPKKPIVKPKEPTVEKKVLEKEPEEEIKEEEVQEEVQEVVEAENILETQQQLQVQQDIREAKQREFDKKLIERINNNKSYPKMARRRGIDGVMGVRFIILADGNVKDIQITSGKGIFKKATIQAIQRSFPIEIDPSIYDFPEVFNLNISYTLKSM